MTENIFNSSELVEIDGKKYSATGDVDFNSPSFDKKDSIKIPGSHTPKEIFNRTLSAIEEAQVEKIREFVHVEKDPEDSKRLNFSITIPEHIFWELMQDHYNSIEREESSTDVIEDLESFAGRVRDV